MIFSRMMLAALAATLLVSCAGAQAEDSSAAADSAQYSVEPLLARHPADSIQSAETASSALKDVEQARAAIEARYQREQRACYPKFFTTACLDKVAERRRQDLAAVRTIEVEANAYIRKAKVIERDRKLAEKAAQSEADAAQRQQQATRHDEVLRDKSLTDQREAANRETQRQKRADTAAQKRADHAARERARQAHAAQDAKDRAENVARYSKKVADAQARQKEVAKKKAQRERQRAAEAAKAAKTVEPAASGASR
jgi:hypothetical protein